MSTLILRSCEADETDGHDPLERCGQPGRPVISTSGRHYTLCDHHIALFDGFVTPIGDTD
jgi:hypothetical protein